MNGVVRATISFPADVYGQLRQEARLLGTSFSGLVTRKVSGKKRKTPGFSLLKLAGKYSVKNFKVITREEIYDSYFRRKMFAGH